MQTIQRKSLLYKSGVEYADYCLNHVEGCSHGCRYPCYAMMMKKRCGIIKDYSEWIKPKIVGNALELLDKEIPRLKDKIKVVHLCFTTDPFMFKQPQVIDLSLKIIKKLNSAGIRCTVLTKGVYPKRLINYIDKDINNDFGITLVSINNKFRVNWEPGSAPCQQRINALKQLHESGLRTWVSMEPYPTPNIFKQDLNNILESVSFVDEIIFGKLNYSVKTTEFKDNKDFYEQRAYEVIEFCERNGINHHIKHGTLKDKNKETEKLFRKYLANSNVLSKKAIQPQLVNV